MDVGQSHKACTQRGQMSQATVKPHIIHLDEQETKIDHEFFFLTNI
jgi:hypothetical protein